MKPKIKSKSFKSRQRARRFAMQALYQWQLTAHSFAELRKQFLAQEEMVSVDTPYFEALVQGVITQQSVLDQQLVTALDRPLKELNLVECAILRLAVYELLQCPELPYKIVLNEAIELAKEFGAIEGYKYVNGTLHALARKLRPLEVNGS